MPFPPEEELPPPGDQPGSPDGQVDFFFFFFFLPLSHTENPFYSFLNSKPIHASMTPGHWSERYRSQSAWFLAL